MNYVPVFPELQKMNEFLPQVAAVSEYIEKYLMN